MAKELQKKQEEEEQQQTKKSKLLNQKMIEVRNMKNYINLYVKQ